MKLLFEQSAMGSSLRVIQHANGKVEVTMSREAGERVSEIVMNLDPAIGAELGTKLSSACFPFEPSSRQRDAGDECVCHDHGEHA